MESYFSLTGSVFLFGLSDSEKLDGDSDKQNPSNKPWLPHQFCVFTFYSLVSFIFP